MPGAPSGIVFFDKSAKLPYSLYSYGKKGHMLSKNR